MGAANGIAFTSFSVPERACCCAYCFLHISGYFFGVTCSEKEQKRKTRVSLLSKNKIKRLSDFGAQIFSLFFRSFPSPLRKERDKMKEIRSSRAGVPHPMGVPADREAMPLLCFSSFFFSFPAGEKSVSRLLEKRTPSFQNARTRESWEFWGGDKSAKIGE